MSTDSPQRRGIHQAVSLAADGLLDEASGAALAATLHGEPRLIDDYLRAVAVTALVEQHCGRNFLSPAIAIPSSSSPAALARTTLGSRQPSRVTRASRIGDRRWWSAMGLAATVLIATCYSGWYWLLRGPDATVLAASDVMWASTPPLHVSRSAGREWVALSEGEIRLAFRSGALVSLQGPVRFRVVDGNTCEMAAGTLSAQVPPAASGFAVQSPGCTVTDLGTGFRYVLSDDGSLDVQVVQGQVQMEALATQQVTQLEAGDTGRFVAATNSLTSTHTRLVQASDSVRFFDEHPATLAYKQQVENDKVWVFLESHGTQLVHDLRLNIAAPGQYSQFNQFKGAVAAGSKVDCYLLHCAPVKQRHIVEGNMTFSGEIVGVLCDSDSLNATNTALGAPWSLRCAHAERGLESQPDRNSDVVRISEDRRSLTFTMRTESIDQMRVLVRAQ